MKVVPPGLQDLDAASTSASSPRRRARSTCTLEVGSAGAEEVTVTAEAPLVETSQGRVSGLIEEDQVKDLPLIGRNFFNLVVLTPGVTGRATGGGQAYAQANADIYSNEFGVEHERQRRAHRVEQLHGGLRHRQLQPAQRRREHQPQRGERRGSPRPREQLLRGVRPQRLGARERDHQERRQRLPRQLRRLLHQRRRCSRRTTSRSRRANFRHPRLRPQGVLLGHRRAHPQGQDVLLRVGRRAALRRSRSAAPARSSRRSSSSSCSSARPNNIATRIARDFPASFTPDRNFRTAGQILGSSCSGATPINSPIGPGALQPPGDRRRAPGTRPRPATASSGRPAWTTTSTGQGPRLRVVQPHDHRQGGLRRARGLPGLHRDVAHEQPAAQHELDEDRLARTWSTSCSSPGCAPTASWRTRTPTSPASRSAGSAQAIQVGWGPNIFVQNSFNLVGRRDLDARRAQHEVRPRLHEGARGQRLGARDHAADVHLRQRRSTSPTTGPARRPDRASIRAPARRPTRSSASTARSPWPPSSTTSGRSGPTSP